MKKRLALLLAMMIPVSMFFSVPSFAITDVTDPGVNTAGILYDSTNGLPTSEANAIVQTPDGFVWIGSYSGLIRYDGSKFIRYDASSGLAGVSCLFVDSQGTLWIGTNDIGVVKYENGNLIPFGKPQGLPSSSVKSVCEDGFGNIVVATPQGLSYISTDGRIREVTDERVKNVYIKYLARSNNGDVYGVTMDGDIFVFVAGSIVTYVEAEHMKTDSVISCICADPTLDGYVFLGTADKGVYIANPSDTSFAPMKVPTGEQKNIKRIINQGDKTWICADNGMGWIDERRNYHSFSGQIIEESVEDTLTDMEGNLWFVSSRKGVLKICEDRFVDISKKCGMETQLVNSTCALDGEVYMGTDSGLWVVDKAYKEIHNELTDLLENKRIRCITKDDEDTLWFSTYDGETGLVGYTKQGQIFRINESSGLPSNLVRETCKLSDGSVAVATWAGLSIIKNRKVIKNYGKNEGLTNTEILTIAEGKNGELRLGSDGDGVYIINDGKITNIGEAQGLSSDVVLRIIYDEKRDVYWTVTSNAICKMQGELADKVDEFPYTNNFDICLNENGKVWVMSSNGIYVTDADDLLKDGKINYDHYDSATGLNCVATANSRSYLDENGTLYIAGSTGVSSVNTMDMTVHNEWIRPVVPYVKADNRMLMIREGTVEIPKDTKRLTIYAFYPMFSLDDPKVSYKLRGFDDVATTTTRLQLAPVTYTNLSGGEYIFTMAAGENLDAKDSNIYAIKIIKEKYIYENVVFKALTIILVILIIILIIDATGKLIGRKRVARAEERVRRNQEFIDQTISAFAKLIDAKDVYTQGHSRRVAHYTTLLAQKLGFTPEEVNKYHNIALLHDIGKVAIPDSILNKPEDLNDEEYKIMMSHAARGEEILKEIKADPDLALGAGYHHERFDGKGYPKGLHAEEIPKVAQLIAVADTFDAMYSTRPYREQLPLKEVLKELKSIAGTQLNKEYVEAFLELADEGKILDPEKKKNEDKQEKNKKKSISKNGLDLKKEKNKKSKKSIKNSLKPKKRKKD